MSRENQENIAAISYALLYRSGDIYRAVPQRTLERISGSVGLMYFPIDAAREFGMAQRKLGLKPGTDYDWILAVDEYARAIRDHMMLGRDLPQAAELRVMAHQAIKDSKNK
jgi:hypothetical protein